MLEIKNIWLSYAVLQYSISFNHIYFTRNWKVLKEQKKKKKSSVFHFYECGQSG